MSGGGHAGERSGMPRRADGFTLVELMITVAVVAIVMSLAVSSYRDHSAKARRGEAMSALLAGAQALERYYSANGRYVTTAGGSTLPAVFATQVPATGTAYYTIAAVSGSTGNITYTLRATRTGSMANDRCGNFDITQAGVQALNGNDPALTAADCWRR